MMSARSLDELEKIVENVEAIVFVVTVLQPGVPFPVEVRVFNDERRAHEAAERYRRQYPRNIVHVHPRPIE